MQTIPVFYDLLTGKIITEIGESISNGDEFADVREAKAFIDKNYPRFKFEGLIYEVDPDIVMDDRKESVIANDRRTTPLYL